MSEEPQAINNISESLAHAQLEKLKLEIEDLRGKNRMADRAARYIPLLSVLITVAGFCFGVYQFRAQLSDNEQRFLKSREIEVTKERKTKLEIQLAEFYYPIALRLEAERTFFAFETHERGHRMYREGVADSKDLLDVEKNTILVKNDEILRIIYSHPDVMRNNPKLKEEIFDFIAYAEYYKTHKSYSSGLVIFDPKVNWPTEFQKVINDQIPTLEKYIAECANTGEKCSDIAW